jgi:phenylacetic acid degradation operon negative regulatory protein
MATGSRNGLDLPTAIAVSLRAAPTTDFLYSSLSFVRGRFGNGVPGTWFVAALGEIGVDPQAVRQSLFRMVRSGVLVARRAGRVKWYEPTPTTVAILDAGGARTREAVSDRWDGQWTLVHLRLDEREREARDRLRDVLLVHGFGRLRSGVYIHPRDTLKLVLDAAEGAGVAKRVAVFRGERHGPPDDEELIRELWDLPALEARYRRFMRRFEPVLDRQHPWSPKQSFALRFAYMFELFRITWDDPGLPSRFLPTDWAGRDARDLGERLRTALRAKALQFASEVAERVGLAA